MKRVLSIFLCALILLSLLPWAGVSAAEADQTPAQAKKISAENAITDSHGFAAKAHLYDREIIRGKRTEANAWLTLTHKEGIGSLYIVYQYSYGRYTIVNNDTGATYTAGTNGFIHEYIDLVAAFGTAPQSVTVRYGSDTAYICEIELYTPGTPPDTVQRWEPEAEGKTDLLLFSTHGDDEQLFFAGMLPYYAKVKGYNVQVVYLTDHRNITLQRTHEMLNGLWAVGCTTYPVFGPYEDFLYETIEETYLKFHYQGVSKKDLIGYCVGNIRRFKPKVVVAHDFAGEYKHGQHMVYADCVASALTISNDPSQYMDTAENFGTWDVPKAYFHLYEENPIVMNWDTPEEALGGLSPFQVTQKYGFPCHRSQQDTWFKGWLNGKNGNVITRADQIATHSPCNFGLYRTTVGPDVQKNDFFENVTTHAQDYAAWLEQNPPAPPETTPPETTPAPTTQAPTEPVQTQPSPAPVDDSSSGGNQILLLCWLAVLCLLMGVLFLLLFLRNKK